MKTQVHNPGGKIRKTKRSKSKEEKMKLRSETYDARKLQKLEAITNNLQLTDIFKKENFDRIAELKYIRRDKWFKEYLSRHAADLNKEAATNAVPEETDNGKQDSDV